MHPKLSIIIPCYNLQDSLGYCFESILKQDNTNVEYIFINDGSSDLTLNAINHFAKDKPFIRVLDKINGGVSSARNVGLDNVQGDYIYLLDGDDALYDDAILNILNIIDTYSPDIIMSSVEVETDDKRFIKSVGLDDGIYTPEDIYSSLLIFPLIPQLVYKNSIVSDNKFRFNEKIAVGEVYEFSLKVLSESSSIVVTNEIYFRYINRTSSATRSVNLNKDLTILETIGSYNSWGSKFKKYDSFIITNFKLLMSFTYNKYAKKGLLNFFVANSLESLLNNPIVKDIIHKVFFLSKTPLKDRLLALYILMTGIWGYKLIAFINKIFK